jgi:hypothetical protein
MILLHPHKTMSKIKRMKKMKITLMIKGEMRMRGIIKDQEQSHHTREYIKPYKKITPRTIFLVKLRRGNH